MSTRARPAGATSGPRSRGGVDLDHLARLEAERDFLLTSLRDLEVEHQAGDLDDDDYRTLRDDYTARAADTLRSIESDRRRLADAPRRPRRHTVLWAVLVALAMAAAVVGVVEASGRRSGSDGLTGDLPLTTSGQLAEAQAKLADGDLEGALAIYEVVLDDDPGNVEALTYTGWVGRMGDTSDDEALALLDEALGLDPSYPDAQVFRAVVLQGLGRSGDAAAQLGALDPQGLPPIMSRLVAGFGVELANELFAAGDVVAANEVLDVVLVIAPEDLTALVTKGLMLASLAAATEGADAEVLADRSMTSLDAAIAVAEGEPEQLPAALLARAQAAEALGRDDVALEDLARIDAIGIDPSLDDQVEALRASLG